MKRRLSALVGAIALVGGSGAASGQTSNSRERLLVIVAAADDPGLKRQKALLRDVRESELSDRDMRVVHVLPDGRTETLFGHDRSPPPPETLRSDGKTPFAATVVGKDGGVKWRGERPVPLADIFALIDSMPMRVREMKGNTPDG